MADNEKLDLLLAEIAEIKTEMKSMQTEMKSMRTEMNENFASMDKRLTKLEVGQSELKRELYKINRKIDDTYNLSLDALGMSAENREWLENGTLKI